MEPMVAPVKPPRSYDSTERRRRAQQQHEITLRTARILFDQDGYTATTVDAVAASAGVSAATIYKSYGGKSGLVRELCRRALEGDGPTPAQTRSDALRNSPDARTIIEGWGNLAAEVSPRVSPLMLLLRAAAVNDPEAATLLAEIDRARLRRMSDNARALSDAGHLRKGVSVHEARDVLWLYTSAEMYELLIVRRRWTRATFASFLTATMTALLLPIGSTTR